MTESWATVARHAGYEVSNLGHVRNRVTGHVLRATQNHSRGGRRPGYLKVNLGRRCQVYVHQLVAEAFLGPKPLGHDVDHKDWDRFNNAASNLRWWPMHENRMRWSPDGFVSKKHDDREQPEDHVPMTEQELEDVHTDLATAGW